MTSAPTMTQPLRMLRCHRPINRRAGADPTGEEGGGVPYTGVTNRSTRRTSNGKRRQLTNIFFLTPFKCAETDEIHCSSLSDAASNITAVTLFSNGSLRGLLQGTFGNRALDARQSVHRGRDNLQRAFAKRRVASRCALYACTATPLRTPLPC